ncbi:MAG TPA: SURF1 family cytochrome oxidase biogenesis protein [Caulobacteraceae bacterium]|nr:SURF1 family cytochrome oxidase biogenesis protein [Caulobacteraceae bacterium]
MTSRPRFPVGLTLAVAIVFAVTVSLGVWQLRRANWKTHELARIAALKHAPPTPIDAVLSRVVTGEDVSFTRVVANCLPGPAAPAELHMISDNGEWIARTLGPCHLAEAPFGGIVVDRGFLASSRGSPNPPTPTLPMPGRVVGVLYSRAEPPALGLTHPAPYTLVAEQETPPAPGVSPAPYPDATDNLQYVGAYWLTWFGLAGAVAGVYAAMFWRRYHPKPNPPR